MELIESLQSLGLNEKEAKVYLALLQTGTSKAYLVSKYSGLKKATTYVILDQLADKGFAIKSPRKQSMYYHAISPEELFETVKNRVESAESVLPELKALTKKGSKKKVSVSYYEGLQGVREMYNTFFKAVKGKEYVGFFAHTQDTPKELVSLFDELNEEIKKKRIKRRAITVDDPSLIEMLSKEWQYAYSVEGRTLPKSLYDSEISIEVHKNLTQIFSHKYIQGIVIDNPDIAKTMKQLFEIVWEKAEPAE